MSFYDFIWKTIIWVGNRYDEKPICFGCGFELRKIDFELICQKGILVFSLLFLGVGKDEIFSETHLLDWALQWITKKEHFFGMMYFF